MTKKFKNLVLEGGGVRGFAYCGAIKQLEEEGVLKYIKNFGGTSVGALFATLLAANFTANEIYNLKDTMDFSFITQGCCLSNVYNVWCKYGINNSSTLESHFREILSRKINPDITLKELYEKTNKELVIVSCCLNRERPIYFHHSNFPNVKLIDALICTISVPFMFKPREYEFLGTKDYYVDGGVVDNYPIWVFNDIDKLYSNDIDLIDSSYISSETLGLKLLCKDEHNNYEVFSGRKRINSVMGFGMQLINTLMMQVERSEISPTYIEQTIPIPTEGIYFLDFNINKEKINLLVNNGRNSVENYFNDEESS